MEIINFFKIGLLYKVILHELKNRTVPFAILSYLPPLHTRYDFNTRPPSTLRVNLIVSRYSRTEIAMVRP